MRDAEVVQTGRCERLEDVVVLDRVSGAGKGDERHGVEIGWGDRRLGGKRMGGANSDANGFGGDDDGVEVRVVNVAAHECQVEVAVAECRGGGRRRRDGAHDDRQIGRVVREQRKQSGDQRRRQGRYRADTQLASLAVAYLRHRRDRTVEALDHGRGLGEQ